jgi:hypothetical protein
MRSSGKASSDWDPSLISPSMLQLRPLSNRMMTSAVTLLPEPDSPTNAMVSRGATSKERLSTAGRHAPPLRKLTVRSRTLQTGPVSEITPDSFRLFCDFLPSLKTQWRELRLRVGRRFLEEWNVPRRWSLDAPSPFEAVRVLDPAPTQALLTEGHANLSAAFPIFKQARIVVTDLASVPASAG